MNRKKILILTSSLGNGHKIVARNLHASFEKSKKFESEVIDIINYKTPIVTKMMNKAYTRLTKFDFPWLMFYLFANTALFLKLKDLWTIFPYRKTAKEIIKQVKPDIIISTWPGLDLHFLKTKNPETKYYSIITDIITIPKYWVNKGINKYFVNDHNTKNCIMKYGIDEKDIIITGYPLPQNLLIHCEKDIDEIAKSFNFKNYKGKKRILCLSGVAPKSKFIKILNELNKSEEDLFLIIINFKNESVRDKINKINFKHEIVHIDWTDKFYELLSFCDIVVTKAGPGVVAESIFFNKYIALFHYIPGQEKGVKEYIMDNELGTYIENPKDINDIIMLTDKEKIQNSLRNFKKEQLNKTGEFWHINNIEKYFQ